jgi:hypothetical protein
MAKISRASAIAHHEIHILQFIDFVDAEMNEKGISLPAAISEYRDKFGRAWKELGSASPMFQ